MKIREIVVSIVVFVFCAALLAGSIGRDSGHRHVSWRCAQDVWAGDDLSGAGRRRSSANALCNVERTKSAHPPDCGVGCAG